VGRGCGRNAGGWQVPYARRVGRAFDSWSERLVRTGRLFNADVDASGRRFPSSALTSVQFGHTSTREGAPPQTLRGQSERVRTENCSNYASLGNADNARSPEVNPANPLLRNSGSLTASDWVSRVR
jgi:hypothetical protein